MLLTPQLTNAIWVKLNESGIKNFDEYVEDVKKGNVN